MNIERRNAFLEAAHHCEAQILDPNTDPPKNETEALLRGTCEAVMRMMAAKFRGLAEESGRPKLTVVSDTSGGEVKP